MEDYLLLVKNEAKNLDLVKWRMVHVVLGSEACDLDSAISTIIYAYLLHETQKCTNTLILPVLNVSRRDLRLKTEVTFFLEENDMSCDLLVLKNEIDLKHLHNCGKLMLTLVDHNALVKPDVNLQSSVVEIIDHHKRSLEQYGQNCKTTIEMVGSCATLVAERVFEDCPALMDAQLAVLLGGTILLDTVCLDDQAGRVTDRDKQAVKKLQKYFPEVNHRQLFQSIQQAKFDISGLSGPDLLRKDLKVVSNSAINIAVVSLPILVQDLMQRLATLKDLKKFNSDNNYHTLVLMGIQTQADTGDVQRDIGVYSINYVCKQQVVDYLMEHPELGLEPCDEENEMMCLSLFRQVNVNASRKMVLPLLINFLRTSSEDVSQLPFKMRNQETVDRQESATEAEGLDDFSDLVNVVSPNGIVSPGCAIPLINVKDTLNVPLSSQNSSNQNSSPHTPLNSYVDGGFAMDVYAQDLLPSFNSRDMMEKIEIKRGNLRDYESDADQEKYPFTPKNSFVDSNFDSYMQQMPPIDVDMLVERVQEARLEDSDKNDRGFNENLSAGGQLSHGSSVTKQGMCSKNGNMALQKEQLMSVPEDDQPSDAVISPDGCSPVSVNALSSTGNPEGLEGRVQSGKSVIAKELEQDSNLNSPDDNSLGSSRGDKGDEKMDISTSGSDKEASSPATVPITHSDSQLVNSTTDRTYDGPTQFGSSTSTLSTGQDLDSEMALNYQAETVDFPDSPHHMKLLTRRSTDEFKATNVDDEMGQDEDEVFKAVLSPGAEDVVLRKDREMAFSTETFSIQDGSSDMEEYFEDSLVLGGMYAAEEKSPIFATSSISSIQLSGYESAPSSLDGSRPPSDIDFATVQKIRACFDQDKIKDVYTLSGRLQDLLTPIEIEEILAKSDVYAEFIDDEMFEALLNACSDTPLQTPTDKPRAPTFATSTTLKQNQANNDSCRIRIALDKNTLESSGSGDFEDSRKLTAVFDEVPMTDKIRETYSPKPSRRLTDKLSCNSSICAYFEEAVVAEDANQSTKKLIPASVTSTVLSDSPISPLVPVSSVAETVCPDVIKNLLPDLLSSRDTPLKVQIPVMTDVTQKPLAEKVTGAGEVPQPTGTLQRPDVANAINESPKCPDRPTSLSKGKKKKIRVTADILNEHDEDDAKSLSSLSNKSADLLSPGDDIATPDDIETPDELEDSLLEGVGGCSEPIPELSAAEEYDEERSWRTCIIAGVQRKIDMKVIDPYKKVLSHGGYCPDTHFAIIVFSACYLPDRGRRDYDYVMDNLFLYVLTTLDQLVAEDYILIYLHGATQRSNMPSFGWLKRCYQMIDRRLRKNLKGLYLVHPTFWLKTIVLMTKPFISTKFSRKLRFVASLQELAEIIPMDHVCIPDKVKQLEFELMIKVRKRALRAQRGLIAFLVMYRRQ